MNDLPKYHKRGYLPHYDSAELTQFITFRLADSLPSSIFKDLDFKLRNRQISEIEYYWKIDQALDLGDGPTFLKEPQIAFLVANAITKFAGHKYELLGWVIMPNHVHLLLKILKGYSLAKVMHSIKGFTATEANKLLGRSGRFWSPDYFDRFIRDREHLSHAKNYIDENPVKAGLCKAPSDWPWGSAGWRNQGP
jgi:REP element-mobilizing transposase RayT